MRGLFMNCAYKVIGYLLLSFTAGVVLTYILPTGILAIIEAVLLIAAVILWLTKR